MTYKIDRDLLESGTRELIRFTINDLELAMENQCPSDVNAAMLASADYSEIDFYLSDHAREINKRFGIKLG